MRSELKWIKDDERNPIVEIENREYCGDCKKHLRFRLGDSVIEIATDDAGLKRISDVIANHPKEMLKVAQAKLDAAKREVESLGATEEQQK